MYGETVAKRAREETFKSIYNAYEDNDQVVTRKDLEEFSGYLVEGMLDEVFTRIDEMRLR